MVLPGDRMLICDRLVEKRDPRRLLRVEERRICGGVDPRYLVERVQQTAQAVHIEQPLCEGVAPQRCGHNTGGNAILSKIDQADGPQKMLPSRSIRKQMYQPSPSRGHRKTPVVKIQIGLELVVSERRTSVTG